MNVQDRTRDVSTCKEDFHNAIAVGHRAYDDLFNLLRLVSKKSKINRSLHIVRQLIHFGPWRAIPKYLIRKVRPPALHTIDNNISLLPSINPAKIAETIRHDSVSIGGVLPSDFVRRLTTLTDKLPPNQYLLVHEVDEDIRQITEDPNIRSVLREYLKCEPELLEVSLCVSNPGRGSRSKTHEQNLFHVDYAGWESLNVFVYLTDVTEKSSFHIVAKGSHRKIRFSDILRGPLTPEAGRRRFGTSIFEITGPAGMLFFENTEAFHRRHKGFGKRVMLNLLYASHRSVLSHGRASRTEIEMRNEIFEKLRSSDRPSS